MDGQNHELSLYLTKNNKPPYHGSLKRKIASNLTNKLHFFDKA